MRITQRAVTLTSLQGLNRNLDAFAKLQNQLTSGRVINKPSDSPTGANRAMQTRSELASNAQQARNISDATGWLEQADTTLRQMLDTVRRVRDLTVQGLNTGSSSASSQEALAIEVASLREGLLGLANTKVQGRPVFGGVTAGTDAYDANGTFVGIPDTEVNRRISDSEVLRVDVTGPEAFGDGAGNLFAVVDRIAASLRASDADALTVDLSDLDALTEGMRTAVADVGSRASRLERVDLINSDRALTLQSQLAQVENIDLPNTIMKVQMQQVGYEAALAATAKALSPTLLDYLR
ncbi:flagellar hook-associated protein FlgL [Candidatus Blastococcus massiliensis]|uniref:flagellar hook-associated protein FlgL n=1 Tax=Candidatus Blastococcus massiliensis TaxID=1470358 RepID=UPI0004B6BD6D|nr:flagellar hook-associated protein FlgL [Candidatus Blastococcus massiliensis]